MERPAGAGAGRPAARGGPAEVYLQRGGAQDPGRAVGAAALGALLPGGPTPHPGGGRGAASVFKRLHLSAAAPVCHGPVQLPAAVGAQDPNFAGLRGEALADVRPGRLFPADGGVWGHFDSLPGPFRQAAPGDRPRHPRRLFRGRGGAGPFLSHRVHRHRPLSRPQSDFGAAAGPHGAPQTGGDSQPQLSVRAPQGRTGAGHQRPVCQGLCLPGADPHRRPGLEAGGPGHHVPGHRAMAGAAAGRRALGAGPAAAGVCPQPHPHGPGVYHLL